MAKVDIIINGRNYPVACDDGQEDHLRELGGMVDARVSELTAATGQIGESRLLLMASLLITDELLEANRRAATAEATATQQVAEPAAFDDELLARGIDGMAQRIEGIAERLERP